MNTRCPFWSKSSNVYSPSESLVPAFAAYRLYQFLYAHTVGEGRSRLLFSDACLDESLRQFLHDLHPLVLTFAARIFPDAHTVRARHIPHRDRELIRDSIFSVENYRSALADERKPMPHECRRVARDMHVARGTALEFQKHINADLAAVQALGRVRERCAGIADFPRKVFQIIEAVRKIERERSAALLHGSLPRFSAVL